MTARETALRAAAAAIATKGVDPSLLDVSGMGAYTSYLLLVSGRSVRQVSALADAIEEDLSRARVQPIGIEGAGGRWILLDYADVVIHVFAPSVRDFYDLESLWAEAPRVPLEVPPEQRRSAEYH